MKILFSILILFFLPLFAHPQAKLVMNGANIVMQSGASLVLQNGNPDAITILNTAGGFIMMDANSLVQWNIGTTSGSFTMPFYFSGNYIPLSFTTSSAVGAGYFDLGTYNVPTWKNSDYLPAGVSNVNRGSVDNSNYVIDRFWSVAANGYSAKPSLSNVVFTYADAEWNAAGNSINENLLKAQRWNSTLSQWSDYLPSGTANTTNNTVTVASITPSNLFQWWTLVDANFPLPLKLLSFKGYLLNQTVKLEWTTSSEINTKEFIVERSSNRMIFAPVDTVTAAGNSNSIRNYSAEDLSPLQGISFYRLKMVDLDGSFTYSNIILIAFTKSNTVAVFPNPAKDKVTVTLGNFKAFAYILTDALGKIIKKERITSPVFRIDLGGFSAGQYILQLMAAEGTTTFKIQKE